MSSSRLFRPIISLLLLVSTASAIDQQYVAFFSAETETYRRIVLDGISDRRIEVTQDDNDQVIINIWGVQKQDYVGRRSYDQGYLVPVKMKIDFPRRSLMTITVSGNVFADGATENTRRDAGAYVLINESVANAGTDVFTPVAGGNWLSDISNSFTVDSDGIITYIGLDSIDAPVSASATVEKGGGGAALICCKIAIDSGSGFAVIDKTIGCTQNATPTQIVSTMLTTIVTGDKFQLWVAIDDGVSTIEVSNARMITGGAS